MSSKQFNAISLCALILFLVGCTRISTLDKEPVVPYGQHSIKISEAAVASTHALRDLAAITQAVHPRTPITPPPPPQTYGMGQQVSIDWSGPLEPLLSKIALVSHYHLRVIGNKPAIPVLVTINATDTPVGTLLRDAGFQADDRANIVVFPSQKTIELRYSNHS